MKKIVKLLIIIVLLLISINSIESHITVVRGYPQNGHIIIPLDPDIEWYGIKKWWIGKEDYTVNGVNVRITDKEKFDKYNM